MRCDGPREENTLRLTEAAITISGFLESVVKELRAQLNRCILCTKPYQSMYLVSIILYNYNVKLEIVG